MKALTVRQPYALWISQGVKPIENRTWRTNYRGPLVIHAGASKDDCARVGAGDAGQLVFGCLFCLVDLVDIVPLDQVKGQPHAEGPWCWLIEWPRPLDRLVWRGMPGLFDVPDDCVKLIA